MNTFERRGDVLRFLSAEVPLLSELIHEQPGVADAIAAPFAIEVMDAGRAPAKIRGLFVRRCRWVVQADDLQALKAIGDGVKAAAGAGFFVNLAASAAAPAAGAVVGVLFALLTLLRQAWKKGAALSEDEMAVLAALTAAGRPLASARIAEALIRQKPDTDWDAARVSKVLSALTKVRLTDGSVKAFVAQDAEESWSAVDPGLLL